MSKINSNTEATEYYKSIASAIDDFCKPLNDYLGIALFTYANVYSDGSYVRLTNDIKLALEYYSKVDNDHFYFQQYLNNTNNLILWPRDPKINSGMPLHFKNGYWNGLTYIVSQSEHHIESVSFLALKDNHKINEFFYQASFYITKICRTF